MISIYTSDALNVYFNGNKTLALLVVLIAEHVILGFKFMLSTLFPILPRIVIEMIHQNESRKKKFLKKKKAKKEKTKLLEIVDRKKPLVNKIEQLKLRGGKLVNEINAL